MPAITLRTAQPADREQLVALQTRSLRVLGGRFYSRAEIESFIRHVGTLDEHLIADGTYFMAEIDGALAGCGGWSLRRPGYARHDRAAQDLEPLRAKVRGVYVDPLLARLGVGRRIMSGIEAAIVAAGHDSAVLAATLSGISFYRALGYLPGAPSVFTLPDGERFRCLGMEKSLRRADAA
jgi:GNAT superfamily N-acetyltransferase